MKSLNFLALLFVLTALPVSAQIGPDGTGVVNGYQIGPDADLNHADLRDADLSDAILWSADLRDADLSGANLTGADLSGANLTGADLSGANLTGAILTYIDLSGVDLGKLLIAVYKGNYDEIQELQPRVETNANDIATIKESVQAQEPAIATNTARGEAQAQEIAALQATVTAMNAQLQQLAAQIPQLQASVAEKDEQIAELSKRPTLEEVQDARLGSAVILKDWESDEVTLNFNLEKSDDLRTWVPFEGGTWTAVANGGVKLTLPLNEAKKLLRVTLKG